MSLNGRSSSTSSIRRPSFRLHNRSSSTSSKSTNIKGQTQPQASSRKSLVYSSQRKKISVKSRSGHDSNHKRDASSQSPSSRNSNSAHSSSQSSLASSHSPSSSSSSSSSQSFQKRQYKTQNPTMIDSRSHSYNDSIIGGLPPFIGTVVQAPTIPVETHVMKLAKPLEIIKKESILKMTDEKGIREQLSLYCPSGSSIHNLATTIGDTPQSHVYLVTDKDRIKRTVVKITDIEMKPIVIDPVTEEVIKSIPVECMDAYMMKIACKNNHPNIVQLYNHCRDEISGLDFIFQEYCNAGTLEDYSYPSHNIKKSAYENKHQKTLENWKPLTPSMIQYIFHEVANGLSYLHVALKMMHGDVKLVNIFMHLLTVPNNQFYQMIVKIGDFGLATIQKELPLDWQGRQELLRHELCTLQYRSPDQLLESRLWHLGVDIWSLGIVVLEMLLAHQPFPREAVEGVPMNVENLNFHQFICIMNILGTPTNDYMDLQQRLTTVSTTLSYRDDSTVSLPNRRSSFSPLLFKLPRSQQLVDYINQHDKIPFAYDWPKQWSNHYYGLTHMPLIPIEVKRLVLSMLDYEPDRRPTITQVLESPYFKLLFPPSHYHTHTPPHHHPHNHVNPTYSHTQHQYQHQHHHHDHIQ
jgi:serine/threonine protein kinase